MDGAGIAVAIVVMGALSAGFALLVCSALQWAIGLVWPPIRTANVGMALAVSALGAVWALIAIPALVVNARALGYFGLVAVGMALVGVPRVRYFRQRS